MELQQTAILKALSSSPLDLLQRWSNYKGEISQEKFDTPSDINSEDKWLFGLTGIIFFVILILVCLPFFISIYLLIKHSDQMPQWARITAWILTLVPLFPGDTLVAIILVYTTKN